MVRELYVWIAFIIVVIAIASYFRFFYQPSIALSVDMQSLSSSSFYPYQFISVPIVISNTGSTLISNMSFGLYINKNVSKIYKATLPAGKSVTIYFNYTPDVSGTYNVSFVADPDRLYNIVNRNAAENSTIVVVLQEQKPEPYVYFNSNGILGADNFNMSFLGYFISRPLYYNASVSLLSMTGSALGDKFFYSTFLVFRSYISEISVSHAFYKNYSLADIWISGYLNPNAIYESAIGQGLNVTTNSNGVTIIDFGNGTTLCSFYSGGWIQNLVSVNGSNCTHLLKNNYKFNYTGNYGLLKTRNYSILNYTGYNGNIHYSGDVAPGVSNSFIFEALIEGSNASDVCYGNILNVSNSSYCSTYFLIGSNEVLSENERLVGNYSINAWSLASNNYFVNASNEALDIASQYTLPGAQRSFVSAFSRNTNRCSFGQYLNCTNESLSEANLSMVLTNNINSSLKFTGISCSSYGTAPNTTLNFTLAPKQSGKVVATCYNNGQRLSGIPLYITFNLTVYYKEVGGKAGSFNGYAYIT